MPNNCSWVGVNLEDDKELNGKAKSVEFVWEFPHIEEDI